MMRKRPESILMKEKVHKILHRDFLGAHRYTTASGGIVRPAGGGLRCRFGRCRTDIHRMSCTLRTALSATQSKGEATLPLRRAGHAYPFVYFASGKALKSRASPSSKSVVSIRQYRVLAQRQKARCSYGG